MGRTTRLLVCVLTLSTAVAVSAQEKRATEPTPAEWRAKIQADKKGVVERAMKLTPEQAKKFWPLYDSFQQELEKPRREYSRAVIDYVSAGDTLNDASAKRLAEQALAATVTESRLREKHFKKRPLRRSHDRTANSPWGLASGKKFLIDFPRRTRFAVAQAEKPVGSMVDWQSQRAEIVGE